MVKLFQYDKSHQQDNIIKNPQATVT